MRATTVVGRMLSGVQRVEIGELVRGEGDGPPGRAGGQRKSCAGTWSGDQGPSEEAGEHAPTDRDEGQDDHASS